MNPNGRPQLAALLLSAAKTLREMRTRISLLVHADDPDILTFNDTTVVLVWAPQVADALETIAARLEPHQ